MSQAIVGLIGVVIGGLLTGGVEFALERRRERRTGTAAARLVQDSLSAIDSFVKASLVRRAWLSDPKLVLDNAPWIDYRVVLAEAPRFDGWYPVAGAWNWIVQLRRLVELFEEGAADDPMENRDQSFFELGLLLVGIADKALVGYAQTESYSDPPDEGEQLSGSTPLQEELTAIFKQAADEGEEPGIGSAQ